MGDIFCAEDVKKLLKGKYIKIIGSSNFRSIYKDLITLSQKNSFIKTSVCKTKGELSCANDKLVEGGSKNGAVLTNGIGYREKRLYERDGIKISFDFITRVYNDHVEKLIKEFAVEKPDVVLINSTLWDINRYNKPFNDNVETTSIEEFKARVVKLMEAVQTHAPDDTLVIWGSELPIGRNPKGAVLGGGDPKPNIATFLRHHVAHANLYVSQEVNKFGFDFIDFHFFMKDQMHRQVKDDTHWDNTGLRRIVNILLTHVAEAWGVTLPGRWTKVISIAQDDGEGNQAVVEDSEIDENKNVKPCDRENAAARRQPNGTQKTIGKRTATDEGDEPPSKKICKDQDGLDDSIDIKAIDDLTVSNLSDDDDDDDEDFTNDDVDAEASFSPESVALSSRNVPLRNASVTATSGPRREPAFRHPSASRIPRPKQQPRGVPPRRLNYSRETQRDPQSMMELMGPPSGRPPIGPPSPRNFPHGGPHRGGSPHGSWGPFQRHPHPEHPGGEHFPQERHMPQFMPHRGMPFERMPPERMPHDFYDMGPMSPHNMMNSPNNMMRYRHRFHPPR